MACTKTYKVPQTHSNSPPCARKPQRASHTRPNYSKTFNVTAPLGSNPIENASPHDQDTQFDTPDREYIIENAIHAVISKGSSIRAAACKFNIPECTLRRRIKGAKPCKDAHINQQILTMEQQAVLAQWVRFMGRQAEPWSKKHIKQKVYEMVSKTPSDVWVRKFLKEHPEIQGSKARGLDHKHVQAFSQQNVYDYFNKLEDIIQTHQIPQENIYNFDEKGIQLGGGRKNSNTLYFFDKEDRNHYILKSDSLVLVTIIEAACADGTPVPPAFTSPRVSQFCGGIGKVLEHVFLFYLFFAC